MNNKILQTIVYIALFIGIVLLLSYIPGLIVGIILGYLIKKHLNEIKSFFNIDLDEDNEDDDFLK
jgi:uncharacterized membrane protein